MKTMHRLSALCLLLLWSTTVLFAQSYNSLWRQVEDARKKSLPQTVVRLTDEIYRKAKREKNAGQLFKAYLLRASNQGQLTPDSLYTRLAEMEQWAEEEPDGVNRAILHSILMDAYADFMNNNHYALHQRANLDIEEAPADIREWSLKQFVQKFDAHALASVERNRQNDFLRVSTKKYVPFIELEEDSRYFNHELYALLVSRAIETYDRLWVFDSDSLKNARIDSLYRQKVEVYTANPQSYDANSKGYAANSQSYEANSEGGLLASLHYLDWLKHKDDQSMNDDAYLQALDKLLEEYAAYPLVAAIYLRKAEFLNGKGRFSEAIRFCEEGIRRYPNYERINSLRNLSDEIQRPALSLWTDKSIYPGDSLSFHVDGRNIKGFSVRIYTTGHKEVPYLKEGITEAFRKRYAHLLTSTHFDVILNSSEGMAKEDLPYMNFSQRYKLPVPDSLGVYLVEVTADGHNVQSSCQFLTTTRFKVLTMNLFDRQTEVLVLDAKNGRPIGGTTLSFYSSGDMATRKLQKEVQTDANGRALIPRQKDLYGYIARKGDDRAMPLQRFKGGGYNGYRVERPETRLTLLTDRSLYRPGQTIYIKGVAYEQMADSAHVLPGRAYEVCLLDANRKEVGKRSVRTNDFGSFTTEFTLPTATLNGTFTITTYGGSTTVRVEEYKRPTFELTFDTLRQAYVLGDTIRVCGKVKALSGIAIQEMPLAYTISRQESFFRPAVKKSTLAVDTVRLDAEGRFSIPVVLMPAKDDPQENSFYFTIEAQVTNEAGETQSAVCTLEASTTPYRFTHSLPKVVCKENTSSALFTISNQARYPLSMQGVVRLYPMVNGKASNHPAYEDTFTSGEPMSLADWGTLPSGEYSLELSATDRNGRAVKYREEYASYILFSSNDKRSPLRNTCFDYQKTTEFDATTDGEVVFGTPFRSTYLFIDLFDETGRRLESRTMQFSDTLVTLKFPYRESYGRGISLLLTHVNEDNSRSYTVELKKRQPNRTLEMKWEVFRDRLRPGQTEEWKLTILTPQGIPASAELLATLYDASLDQLYKRNQSLRLFFPTYFSTPHWLNYMRGSINYDFNFPWKRKEVPRWAFDHFFSYTLMPKLAYTEGTTNRILMRSAEMAYISVSDYKLSDVKRDDAVFEEEVAIDEGTATLTEAPADLRTNFAETAFFYPQLRTNERGEVVFSFTVPQSLTRWNFRGYAHTKEMQTGQLNASVVTAKEFMLIPNLPRFVRVGDKTQITATVANQTDRRMKGTATLTLFDPMTERIILKQKKKFSADAGRNTTVTFAFEATDKYDLLGVRIIADGGAFSDGEQHLLPVLSNKEQITETIALPIRGGETRTFRLDSLFNGNSPTATERRLTVEFTANPAWYAVQALPVLTQPDNDNALSWATVYYANTLAAHIARSNPRIRPVLEAWKASGRSAETLHSKLEQNGELKSILLAETPWLLDATTESERMQRLADLFDDNRQHNLALSSVSKLRSLQAEDGSWSWFKGMSGSRHITAYITELLTRLPLLTRQPLAADLLSLRTQAMNWLHKEAQREYTNLKKAEQQGATVIIPSEAAMDWLYLIAISGEQIPANFQAAYAYLYNKVKNNLEHGSIRTKARSAIILSNASTPNGVKVPSKNLTADFLASLREHLIVEPGHGAHFAFLDTPYRWSMLPIPTHVAAMEALALDTANIPLIEEMKFWLLKQKQTTAWNSSVATADALYALLMRGHTLLAGESRVRITLGSHTMTTATDNPLGYTKNTYTEGAPELDAPTLTVEKSDAGIAWGALYAQYLSPLADVSGRGGALSISKQLYVERVAVDGKKFLQSVSGQTRLRVGDKLVSRLTLRLDRAMDYLRLADRRAACLEPIATLSGYRWSGGIGYYTEVEDAGCNFFFDHLGKGVYILEHSCRVTRAGTYQDGLATLQCAYAPEFAAHSVAKEFCVVF